MLSLVFLAGLGVPAPVPRKTRESMASVGAYYVNARRRAMAVYVHPRAVVEGDVRIGPGSSIWACAVLRGDEGWIVVGRNVSIQENSSVHGTGVRVGDNVSIGHNAVVHGCKIGSNCIIGMGAIVLSGARIGPWCIVGAGAVVTEGARIPAGSLVQIGRAH